MSRTVRLGGFGFQVRLVLLLLVLFLVTLDLLNLRLLADARQALTAVERRRCTAQAEAAVERLGRPALLGALEGSGPRPSATHVRRVAQALGLRRLAVLDPRGRPVASSDASGEPSPRFAALAADERAALAAGRVVLAGMHPARGGADAQLALLLPVVAPSGRWAGTVEAWAAVPELGGVVRNVRLLWAVQGVGVVAIAALALLFANWISRPYRRLAAAVGESGLGQSAHRPADPEDLAAAFRAVAAKLRDQEQALGELGARAGGVGDLVRFATGPASAMSTGVLVVDRHGRVAGANPAAARLLGRGEPAALRSLELARLPLPAPGLAELVRSCVEQGRGVSREVLEVRGEGVEPGHLGVAISPAPGMDGTAAGALVLMTDLTEIRHVQAQARLRESLASVGQLSAGIAHEFRNALGTILGYARMLEKIEEPRVRGPAREIVREVDSVRLAVDEFLLFARPPEPVRIEVELLELLRACAAGASDGIAVTIDGEFGRVLADEGLLRRAFGNLLQNAADVAAEEGRLVSVRITGRRVAGGGALQLDVADDGPGIPPERRAQVFVPFFTTRARGTGLGLALVQRTIVDLGGTIEVGDAPGGGAAFRIRLPLREAKRDGGSGAPESGGLPRTLTRT